MLQEKQQGWSVPLRVRFRPPTNATPWMPKENQIVSLSPVTDDEPTAPSLPVVKHATLQQNRQIKELIRLGNVLRAELGLDEVLAQVAAAINSCLGFRSSVIKLIEEGLDNLKAVAFAGISEEDKRALQAHPMRVGQMLRMMQSEFQISQSYFISHEYAHLFADVPVVGGGTVEQHCPGAWHPEDLLIIPLFSPRQQKLLGFLSLDDPSDGKVPTEESIEMVELFASQAAIAIDNARIFQERET
ncbi:MAG TPA: GAF domain-containing protein, partial [Ktedonobacteraceae bacterium]|nr:GAF domain-containing protein [Ktedonobacteraceae bacterium]